MQLNLFEILRGLPLFPAGMPTVRVTLSEFGETRLEIISLFAVAVLASAFVVQGVWNGLKVEFPRLPYLTYRKALAVVFLWGLLFVIVLTMISGARELMTPGAWIQKGNTYELASTHPTETASDSSPSNHTAERRDRIALLGGMLIELRDHNSGLPLIRSGVSPHDEQMWFVPQAYGLQYVYIPELTHNPTPPILLAEPEFFTDGRLVVWAGGKVELIPPGKPLPLTADRTPEENK